VTTTRLPKRLQKLSAVLVTSMFVTSVWKGRSMMISWAPRAAAVMDNVALVYQLVQTGWRRDGVDDEGGNPSIP
jgi:hypothetical protein